MLNIQVGISLHNVTWYISWDFSSFILKHPRILKWAKCNTHLRESCSNLYSIKLEIFYSWTRANLSSKVQVDVSGTERSHLQEIKLKMEEREICNIWEKEVSRYNFLMWKCNILPIDIYHVTIAIYSLYLSLSHTLSCYLFFILSLSLSLFWLSLLQTSLYIEENLTWDTQQEWERQKGRERKIS